MNNTKSEVTDESNLAIESELLSKQQLSSTSLIHQYRYMLYGGLLLIILLTLGNAFYLSKQMESQVLNEEDLRASEVMLTLTKNISVSLNHVDKMRDSIESAYDYRELAPGQASIDFLTQQALGSPVNAPWERLPENIRKKVGQLFVKSNARDYFIDISTLLTMMPEVIATHKQHQYFQWSYYYDAQKTFSLLYPWVSYKDVMKATNTSNVDDTIDVIYEAGGTFPVDLVGPSGNSTREKKWTAPYMDAAGKKMMVSLLAPVYHLTQFIGAVGTDITLKALDETMNNSYLKIGRLAVVDEKGIVIGDNQGSLSGKVEVVLQPDVLSLVEVGAAHQVKFGELQETDLGYWISYPLEGTPWKLVLEVSHSALQGFILNAILPHLVMGGIFVAFLLFIVLYQHNKFSEPALQLALFIEKLSLKSNITIPNIPKRWRYWFKRVATSEQERRDHLLTIEKQTHELELRVEERTKTLKEALEILKATQDKLVRTEKLAGLGSLVVGIAHEMNTPIGNAILTTSTLKAFTSEFVESTKQGLRRSTLDNYINQSNDSIEFLETNLQMLVKLISNFKQVSVDQSTHQRRIFDLTEVLNEFRVAISPSLLKSNIVLKEECFSEIKMDSYPGVITQVLLNLFSNAQIHAFSDKEMQSIAICCTLVNETSIAITVTDNGQGIAPQNLNKIFDPFFTTRLGEGGSGLGLHVVHNMVTEILGGEISVESEEHKGCCFILMLPLKAPEIVIS